MILNLRTTLLTTFLSAACLAAVTGCPAGNPLTGSSTMPGSTASMTPATAMPTSGSSTMPTTTTSPAAGTATACGAAAPATTPMKAPTTAGKYAGLLIPGDWTTYTTETEITTAIQKQLAGTNKLCFEKFYPDTVAAYKK